METLKQVWNTLALCREKAPSPNGIVDDLMALPHVLRRVVADNDLRSGKRYVSVVKRKGLKNIH